jgi:phospholipid/cholesterol/gamma-HCH transport system substrate-binding protein
MSRTLRWRELKTGVVALAVIVTIVLSVLLFARVGALHGDTSSIYVLTDDAPGVLNGTEVWLSGQKIGLVKDIHFRPVSTDTLQRLAIHTQILSQYMHYLRRDAYADIRPGGNLIGSPIVFISSGTSRARALNDGDTLIEIASGKMKPVGDRVTALGNKVAALADSGGRVLALLNSQIGTLGKLGSTGIPKIAATTGAIASLVGKARTGDGTLARAMNGDIGAHIAHIRAQKDSISTLMSSGDGTLGRLHRDSTLQVQVAQLMDEIDSLRVVYSGTNQLSRARSDPAIAAQLAQARAELAAIMKDLKKHPTTYLRF